LGLEAFVLDFSKVKLADNEPGWQDMALIDVLDKSLNSGLLDEFLLAEASLGLDEVAGNAGDEQMRESVFLHRCECTLFPDSNDLTTTAFFPANFP